MIQKLSIFTVCIVILPLILSRSSCSGEEPPKPKVIKLNRELKEMEFVRYWLKDHANVREGGVELDFVLRFASDEKVTLAELGPGRASHSFLVFILPGGHRIFVSFMRTRQTIGIYAYDRTLKRNLIQKAYPIVWKQGEAHTLRVDWGKFLTLHVDGRKLFSKRWEGLTGPWEIKEDQ
ncbi:MAG: hypothetical protein QF473_25220, partial [Planctomycetota bacterium]|nr:hypothetical protein [Planctomycetota bacterium]